MNTGDYALLIGFDHYKSLTALKGPISDAADFRSWLLSSQGGNIPQDNCFFIPSEPSFTPGQDHIDDNIDLLLENIGQNPCRRLYIFFAGHGFGVKYDDNGLLLPKWSLQGRNAAFSSKHYLDYFIESGIFSEVFLFLDCCRDLQKSVTPRPPRNGWAVPRGGQCRGSIFFASEFAEPSLENPDAATGLVRGNFSLALMRGLRGGAVNDEGHVTLRQLARFTKMYTEKLASENKQLQKVQVNHIHDDDEVDIILASFPQGRPLSEVSISFLADGTYSFRNPELVSLREGTAEKGSQWVIEDLRTGIYIITEITTERHLSILIDNSQKKYSYEF